MAAQANIKKSLLKRIVHNFIIELVVFLDIPSLAGFIGTMARKWFYKRAIRLSREIFTVSNFSRNRIMEKLGCRKKINVVYSGIPAYIEREIPSTKKTDSILFIGNIKKHKGLSILIKAYERFCINFQIASMDPPTLLIVGAQENFRTRDKEVIKSIDSLNKTFSSPVKFSGFVDDECLHVLLKPARLLMLKNLYLLHDPSFDEELRRAAIYITDRKTIFDIVEAAHYQLKRREDTAGIAGGHLQNQRAGRPVKV